jgi:hypothetical protein
MLSYHLYQILVSVVQPTTELLPADTIVANSTMTSLLRDVDAAGTMALATTELLLADSIVAKRTMISLP